jgi:hypothetical protein
MTQLERRAAAMLGLDTKTAVALLGQARDELGKTQYRIRLLGFVVATSGIRQALPVAVRRRAVGAFLAGLVATAADTLAYLGLATPRERAEVARGLLPP